MNKHGEYYQRIDDADCGVCVDGMIEVLTQHRPDDYVPASTFDRYDDGVRSRLIEQYGSIDRVPRGFGYPCEMRGTRTMYACLCRLGRLKESEKRLRSITEVWTDAEIAHVWPSGVPSGQARPDKAMLDSGVPPACAAFSLASYQLRFHDDRTAARYLKYCGVWLKTIRADRGDLILFGPNGTGKTGLAIALLRACYENRETIRFWSVRELSMAWRETYRPASMIDNDDAATEREMLAALVAPDVLVLDEITGTRLNEFVEDTITMIVDRRQKELKSTILTLNVAADTADEQDAIASLVGPALYDRLRERAQFWPLTGESKRTRFAGRR